MVDRALDRESVVLGSTLSVFFLKKLCDSGHITTPPPLSKNGSLICKMKSSTRNNEVQGRTMAAETERPRFESELPSIGFIILGELVN